MSLKGKTAVVTGGASGIGLATARNYLKEEVVVSLEHDSIDANVLKQKISSILE